MEEQVPPFPAIDDTQTAPCVLTKLPAVHCRPVDALKHSAKGYFSRLRLGLLRWHSKEYRQCSHSISGAYTVDPILEVRAAACARPGDCFLVASRSGYAATWCRPKSSQRGGSGILGGSCDCCRDLARYDCLAVAACLNEITIFSPIGADETYQDAWATVRTRIIALLDRRVRFIVI